MRQPVGGRAGVAQQLEVPVGAAQLLGEPPEREQPGVRVGALGKPAEQHGQELALERGPARRPLRQRGDVPHRTIGVAVADGREPGARRLGSERDLVVGQVRHGRQQRAVEERLVQRAHVAAGGAPPLHEVGGAVGARVHGARDAAQVGLVGGQQVRAPQLEELDAVLEHAQEPVADGEPRRVVAAHVAGDGERAQRRQGVRRVDGSVAAAVHELEELHGELHVAQPAAAQLDLAVRLGRGHVLLDAAAHGLRVLDEVLARHRFPHERVHGLPVRPPELAVARHRPRLEQRLELPGGGPAVVVREVAGQRAHQRPVLALGPQRGVHLPERRLGRRRRAHLLQRGGEPRADGDGVGLGGGRAVGPDAGLDHVDHVDVGHVVELAPTRLAHADDGEASGRVVGVLRPGDGEGRLERCGGEVGERRRHGRQHGECLARREVVGGDVQEPGPVGTPQCVGGSAYALVRELCGIGGSHRRLGGGIRADGGQQLGPHHLRVDADARLREGAEQLGTPDDLVTEGGRRPEHREQPQPDAVVGRPEDAAQRRGRSRRPGEPDELEQRQVRVRGGREGVEHPVRVVREHRRERRVLPEAPRPGEVREARTQQPPRGALCASGAHRLLRKRFSSYGVTWAR